jgi:hypothetical protein
MNISDGPLSGCMPTEKAAGKIISDAKIATIVSIVAICHADFIRFTCLPK